MGPRGRNLTTPSAPALALSRYRPASIDVAKVRAMKLEGIGAADKARALGIAGQASIGVGSRPTIEGSMIKPDIDALGVQERLLLFCVASGTDWKQAGVTFKTVAGIVGAGVTLKTEAGIVGKALLRPNCLVMPTPGGALALTDAGRAALRALLRDL